MPIDLDDYSRTPSQKGWGSGWPQCGGASGNVVTVVADLSGTRIAVHSRIARLIDILIDRTEKIHHYRLKPGQCGGFNCRPIDDTNRPSNHSWALAIDINWHDNPYTTTGKHDIPTAVARMFNRYGFAWGGDYSGPKKDWMHFEFMGTPRDADEMLDLAIKELLHSHRLDDLMSEGFSYMPNQLVPVKDSAGNITAFRPDFMRDDTGEIVWGQGSIRCPVGSVSAIVKRAWFSLTCGWQPVQCKVHFFGLPDPAGDPGWLDYKEFILKPNIAWYYELQDGTDQIHWEFKTSYPTQVLGWSTEKDPKP